MSDGPINDRRRWRPSLQAHLILLVSICAVVAGTSVAYARARSLDQIRRTTADRVELQAAIAADDIVGALDEAHRTLTDLAANPGLSLFLAAPTPGACTLTFTGAGPFPDGHIDVVNRAGVVLCSSRELPAEAQYAGAPWLAGDAGEQAVVGPVDDPASGGQVLIVSAPIGDLGAVATFLDLAPVESMLADTFQGPQPVEFTLLDADGKPVTAERDDGGRIAGAAEIPALGWTIEAAVDRDAALADARALNRQLVSLLLIGLAVVSAATYLVYRRLARPIAHLSAAVRGAMDGGEPPALPTTGPAEVLALAEDYSTLRSDVIDELRRRRGAEAEARSSEASYRTLFAANPLPMWVYDEETLAFLDVNDAAVAAYGYSKEEFLHMTVGDIRPADEVNESSALGAVTDRSGPWRHVCKDGTVLEVEITSHAVAFGEHPGRFVMAEDVTQRERTRHLLQQTQRMESLGELAGGIAHDFNNVLAVMLNYADFAADELRTAAEADPERWEPVLHDVSQIGIAGRRAAELTRQLLSFARGDSADTASLDLNDVVVGIDQMLRRLLGEQIELQLSLALGVSPIVANASQIEQVIVNLVVNARDAMSGGGQVLIETSNVEVDAHRAARHPDLVTGHYTRLRISDTGSGMDASARDHAFEPFFTTKARGTGTGLGLATVYGVVHRAGGATHIHSEPGLGTSVTALFPSTEAASDESQRRRPSESAMMTNGARDAGQR